ncbi:uncharacterized protein PHALS_07438 [Plasmopara halstedii]|uniref:Uncharacterized protein n=1 Tax=Plasmopara halstedii TaxID=4781 RepID=A0A0P1B773_PLAHL|nr:uncharacterized protein PHALS_07438 [Plasmopara halstedii]CEG49686.1 hypothetical protein PHALS_07438 [Plasmopara halstedii]|eukprot:XP_024586055.1 hypothetical protein PHALS_07438 [Plasmopara halstedii]
MAVQVNRNYLPRMQRLQPRPTKTFRGPSPNSTFRHRSHPKAIELPEDVRALKFKILRSHPTKLTRFSISHMRHMATPPVIIPDTLNERFATKTFVSGKNVPLTMRMWQNCKKKAKHLDMIDEYVTYR